MAGNGYIWKADRITAGYRSEDVLKNVSLAVQPGMALVIIGQNGSGKSTLLKALGGIIQRRGGEVWLQGRLQTGTSPEYLVTNGVSFFLQGSLIIPELTVLEHLHLAVLKTMTRLNEPKLQAVFDEFPDLKRLIGQHAGKLSGGERQLLTFAMLELQQTDCWLLDEPTAGLSPALVRQTAEFLMKKNQQGTTMIIVEHNLEVAFAVASHIGIMRNGSLSRMYSRVEFLHDSFLEKQLYN